MSSHSGSFAMQTLQARNCHVLTLGFAGLLALAAVAACHCLAPRASAALPATPPAAQGDPRPLDFDACTVFTAADAAQVVGVPVRPVTSVGGCSYEAAKETSGGWRRNVAVNVSKYKSAADENSAWGDLKILRHLEPGRKNLTVVNGVGSEAYLQISPDRKSFDGEVWVHKNVSHFRLIAVSEQPPSPDVLKTAAQKIAAKLP
jgi:hypothetical protein